MTDPFWIKFNEQTNESEKALCFDNQFWIPKSQIRRVGKIDGKIYAVEIPRWLIEAKALQGYIVGENERDRFNYEDENWYCEWGFTNAEPRTWGAL